MTGDELRAARRRLGVTQAGLARMLDVSKSIIEKWERGLYPVPLAIEFAMRFLAIEDVPE